LSKSGVRRLAPGERLVGTGGTIRNLAKIDRQSRRYPIGSLHGYELPVDRLAEVVERLAATREKRRDEIPGLSAERADSIVGGAIAIHALAEFVRARQILVSGHGVREGVALGMLNMSIGSPDSVKDASLSSLVSRFDGWRADVAARRREVAAALQRALQPKTGDRVAAGLDRAALVLDIGRTFDVVARHEHTADILLTTDLNGFSHNELAFMSAIVRRAGDRHAEVPPLGYVREALDSGLLDRTAVLLSLADEIEARCPRGKRIAVRCTIGRSITVSVPLLPSWLAKDLDKRFERAFGKPLVIRHS
jgi:exopolyphosphatase/guanosine-5'-triphosphate,3'-diphosphate pyrophosphatase